MKRSIFFVVISTIFFQCSTVQQPIGFKPIPAPSLSDGVFREFPKDVFRAPYSPKNLNEESIKIKSVDFIDVNDLFNLSMGLGYDEVIKKLKKNPYDILFSQKDGYKVVSFIYKRIFIITDDRKELLPNMETTSKELGFDFKEAYLMFNNQNKLEMVASKESMLESINILKFARDTYRVIKNQGENLIKTDTPDNYFISNTVSKDSIDLKIINNSPELNLKRVLNKR